MTLSTPPRLLARESGAIQSDPDSLANNLGGVDKVVKDSSVHGLQSPGPWPLLLQLVGLPGWLGQNSPLGDEHDMLPRELLLQLPHQPCLDLLEGFQLWHRNENHDCLLSPGAVHLLSSSDVELPQLSLQVGVDLQVEQGLADALLFPP